MIDYERQILALDDKRLEKFVLEWIESYRPYFKVKRFAGAGDAGRDVVGFSTKEQHEGEWDNYQCKQLKKTISKDSGLKEVGKILYNSYVGKFSLPKNFYFVAPNGVNRTLEDYIFNPSQFKKALIDGWNTYCAGKISSKNIPLTDDLKCFLENFDYSTIQVIDIDTLEKDKNCRVILVEWFGGDMIPPPEEFTVPSEIQLKEVEYVNKLLEAYSEDAELTYSCISQIESNFLYNTDFKMQRERYYCADAFIGSYRDNTVSSSLDAIKGQIYSGVFDTLTTSYPNGFLRMKGVMKQAAIVSVSGKLSIHVNSQVKQGYCHHIVTSGELCWCF
ncbi:ABC-three component system protein [Vibrio echinoideorum]|uniref:ABC-three component system protein n=1 Tax=Vibrio echinoideorum TaxID=2100116 RepID=A0ABU9FSD9_9VIBR